MTLCSEGGKGSPAQTDPQRTASLGSLGISIRGLFITRFTIELSPRDQRGRIGNPRQRMVSHPRHESRFNAHQIGPDHHDSIRCMETQISRTARYGQFPYCTSNNLPIVTRWFGTFTTGGCASPPVHPEEDLNREIQPMKGRNGRP